MRACPTSLLLFVLAAGTAAAQSPGDVTVYRCTDASGRVALQDMPCADGQTQRERAMLRPNDPPPTPPRPAPQAPPPAAAAQPPQVVVLRAPQPMYRCTRPEGGSYTSDSDAGNPRWVPLWTLGYGPPRRRPPPPPGTDGGGAPPPQHRPPRHSHYPNGAAGIWVRDDCQPIPQHEVCRLLVDRRETIRRRFFNAQPTERDQLRREEGNINTRLDNDCRA